MRNTVAIVDALSTGNELAAAFMARGCDVIHIWHDFSRQTRTQGFIETLTYEGSLGDILSQLKKWPVNYVIAGADSGIELADMLASAMGISAANNPETTAWRRNKYESHQRLAAKGIRSIRQFKSSSASDLIAWADRCGFPVIVKPLNSGASDGVTLCENKAEVAAAAAKLLGKKNLLGYVNDELLVQELIDGVQYFVNTLSWNGQHYVSDIWEQVRSRVAGGAYNFEGMHLTESHTSQALALADYTVEVLSALGLEYGAAHNEIILTESGPVLIELNARLMGASINETSFTACLGYTQVSLCADMYLTPEKFIADFVGSRYQLKAHVSEISFLFKRDGWLEGMPGRKDIEQLSSFSNFFGLPTAGQAVSQTRDTKGLPGFAYLLHQDHSQLKADFEAILRWQQQEKIFLIDDLNHE